MRSKRERRLAVRDGFNVYQNGALETALTDGEELSVEERLRFALGVVDEAGEVAAAYKKFLRGDYGEKELQERIKGEIGDVLWYLAVVSWCEGLEFGKTAWSNYEKLLDRLERGKIKGDGDER